MLKIRAQKLQEARRFFETRNVLEVDCGALVKRAPLDPNIDCLPVEEAFLHTSPEYALKKLLAKGIGDCYFLGHVYRKEELGSLHNPEFTMVEWYRLGFTLSQMIQETAAFLSIFVGELPVQILSYRTAFEKFLDIDYREVPLQILQNLAQNDTWSRRDCLHYLLSQKIEPHLGRNTLTALTSFPASEAALAKTAIVDGEEVSLRFEIYYEGIELANGYHELSDASIIKERFQKTNKAREQAGKTPYLLDENFLASLDKLPDCSGVALGFDRALMLHLKLPSIQYVLPWGLPFLDNRDDTTFIQRFGSHPKTDGGLTPLEFCCMNSSDDRANKI